MRIKVLTSFMNTLLIAQKNTPMFILNSGVFSESQNASHTNYQGQPLFSDQAEVWCYCRSRLNL